ncbi:hypothetical protein [Noviherbaspirillum malthae]|uniref:hypothetical protein n=1 Tax=Noviherbaspirillum malthae TaxID=1260987 RepID=UPI00188FF815|nr:hypothetical protein [Noviherbaspirillum malthae]
MDWMPIVDAPLDGTPVILRAETNPEYGEHLMRWSKRNKRWECKVYVEIRKIEMRSLRPVLRVACASTERKRYPTRPE